MRIRIDGDELHPVVREATLSLRAAGFVVVYGDADYVVHMVETLDVNSPVELCGADGPLERLAINKIAAIRERFVLARATHPNDAHLRITMPPDDALRRQMSRALTEIFLSFVSAPGPRRAVPVAQPTASPLRLEDVQAQVLRPAPPEPDPTVLMLTDRLVALSRLHVETVERDTAAIAAVNSLPSALSDLRASVFARLGLLEQDLPLAVDAAIRARTPLPQPSWWRGWFR